MVLALPAHNTVWRAAAPFSGRYLPKEEGLLSMQDVRLTVKKRAFPSHGRVRLNAAVLPDLGVAEGEHVDLVNEIAKKSVSVTVIADTMVPAGQVRVSEEDLKAIGMTEGSEVLVRKTPPLKEKITKAAADTNASIAGSSRTLDAAARKTAGEVSAGASSSVKLLKKETKKASVWIEKTAAQTAKDVKKTVKKASGKGDDL
jgi:formylmethanofuran dehydrogenase subunit D